MARGLARSLLLLLVGFAVAVPQAGGRSLATTAIVVQVVGGGEVVGGDLDCGASSRSCYTTTSDSGTLTLTADAPAGWSFSGWDFSSTDCSGASPTCDVPLDGGSHEEVADFAPVAGAGTSTLTVTTSTGGLATGGQIECAAGGSSCDWTVPTGSTLTLVETADTGYVFDGWAGACTGTARSCTVVMDTDHSVSAVFRLSSATRVLTVTVSGAGTVSGGTISCTSAGGSGCTSNETLGAQVTLTATPEPGNSFQGWGGDCSGTTTCTVAMTSNKNVTAAFSGSSGGGSTARLTVTVSGPGRVTGGGIDCGSGASTCSVESALGARVTLTAAPASDASFEGWSGACSGTDTTCTLTMSAARSVSASFASQGGGGTEKAVLTIQVSGRGSVSTSAGRCQARGGARTCKQSFPRGSTVPLIAAPGKGARFVAWGGACTGSGATCTVVLSRSRSVTARFTGASAAAAVASSGRPLVHRAGARFEVVLRFAARQAGTAHLRALRAGRVMAGFSFTVAAGPGSVGPFALSRPGYYTFELRLGEGLARWAACLGRCGAAAPGSFTLEREPVEVVRAGALWSLTVHFRESGAAAVQLRIHRSRALIRDERYLRGAGSAELGPFLLSPGTYALRLTATDGYGRVQRLKWIALLE